MINDNTVICRHCGSDVCYEIKSDTAVVWECLDCGFHTSTAMLKGSDIVKYLIDTSPSLINDISYEDEDGFVWYPKVRTLTGIGIIFPNGTSVEDWRWAFAKEIPLTDEEKAKSIIKNKSGETPNFKIDYANRKEYGRTDYILALVDAGVFN